MSVTENPQINIFIILWRKISYDPIHVCIVKKRYLANRVVLMAYRDYTIFLLPMSHGRDKGGVHKAGGQYPATFILTEPARSLKNL